jgi:hypothetical protein
LGRYSGEWTGYVMQVSEVENGIARQSEKPALAVRYYDEHVASHRLNWRSDQFVEHVQVDITMQAAKCSIETPSISSLPLLGANVKRGVTSVEQRGAVEGERDSAM